MAVTPEELAAFADDELDPARRAEVAAAVAADPTLAEQVRSHRALKERLGRHFAPFADAPLPENLTAMLPVPPHNAEVIDLVAVRDRRVQTVPRWAWFAGPALAASLALAILLPRGDSDYAQGALAEALEGQLVASQGTAASTRILLSFRDRTGAYCRAFAGEAHSGIACRDANGWRLRMQDGGAASAPGGEYRMAGATAAQVMERAQAMAAGPAFDASREEAARKRGWR